MMDSYHPAKPIATAAKRLLDECRTRLHQNGDVSYAPLAEHIAKLNPEEAACFGFAIGRFAISGIESIAISRTFKRMLEAKG